MATFISNGTPITSPSPQYDIPLVSNNGAIKARHQSGLPLGYTRLDYLQSDGASYLIIPYRVNNKTVFYCRYNEIQNGPQTANAVFGVTDAPDVVKANDGILRLTGSAFNRMGWGDDTTDSTINVTAPKAFNTWYEVLYNQNELYQDGTLYATSATDPSTVWSANYGLGIFARNSTSVTMPAIAKISSVWAKEDGEYKVNLVPAKRNSDNVLGMYDLVSGQFFVNQGTGDFTAGNPVSDPVEIYTDGTVETINVHGKNLFDPTKVLFGYYRNRETGQKTSANNNWMSSDDGYISCLPNTTYTFVGTNKTNGTYSKYNTIYFFDSAKNYLGASPYEVSQPTTGTTPSNCRYLQVRSNPLDNSTPIQDAFTQFNWQLEQGSTVTAYQPYYNGGTATAEMLLKIGDYQDVQSIIDGVVTRNVGVLVLDGTEAWSYSAQYSRFVTNVPDMPTALSRRLPFISTHYQETQSVTSGPGYIYNGSNRQIMITDAHTSVEDWTQWLADQYAAGHPVIILYPLDEPTTESVAGQTMQVTDGDNTLEITQASLNNLELEAEYQAAVSLTIQEVQDANLDPNVQVTIN